MRISFSMPKALNTNAKTLRFSYPQVGATRHTFPPGYNHDRTEIFLGTGNELWEATKIELLHWRHYPDWTRVFMEKGHSISKSEHGTVGVYFKMFGLWWENHCRIVYVQEKESEWGFAYGTLSDHVEKGEEYFYVRRDVQGKIYYGINAFSRPNLWFTWLGYPLARFYQRKFVKDSLATMKKFALAYEK